MKKSIKQIAFEWDDKKEKSNIKKHGINFYEAANVIFDPNLLTLYDEESEDYQEQREINIGYSNKGRVLFVITTEREGNTIRIISARKATKKERRLYEKRI